MAEDPYAVPLAERYDPLDAPPPPDLRNAPAGYPRGVQLSHPTPVRATYRPYVGGTAPQARPAGRRISAAAAIAMETPPPPAAVPDFRASLPPAVPEGSINPGVVVAFCVVALTAGFVGLWYAGETLLAGAL